VQGTDSKHEFACSQTPADRGLGCGSGARFHCITVWSACWLPTPPDADRGGRGACYVSAFVVRSACAWRGHSDADRPTAMVTTVCAIKLRSEWLCALVLRWLRSTQELLHFECIMSRCVQGTFVVGLTTSEGTTFVFGPESTAYRAVGRLPAWHNLFCMYTSSATVLGPSTLPLSRDNALCDGDSCTSGEKQASDLDDDQYRVA
jgi:hypothetical protein